MGDGRTRAFLWLLLGILIVYGLIVGLGDVLVAGGLRTVVLGLILMGALRVHRRQTGRRMIVTGALVLLTLIAAPLARAFGAPTLAEALSALGTIALVAATIVTIARSVLDVGAIDGAAVVAVLCVYLLLALFFSGLYQLGGVGRDGFLNGVDGTPNAGDFLYLSVITLATVGYGDITPATDLGRTIAITEALVGQLYLVSVVAAVVARWRRA